MPDFRHILPKNKHLRNFISENNRAVSYPYNPIFRHYMADLGQFHAF
nr:MAG TPA: hypothetical protein [Caudoviricetes sp.]